MKAKTLILFVALLLNAILSLSQANSTFTDSRDGKTYKTIKIGTQTWMTRNLAFKSINGNFWNSNNQAANELKFGFLYDFETAKTVCPSGWHLPNDAEWTTMIDYLGGENIAGGKMKTTNTWNNPNKGATNKSGFSALPAGFHNCDDSTFVDFGKDTRFWSSTPDSTCGAWGREIYYKGTEIYHMSYSFTCGYSVRCIKD
jgi:uncharacterized protein (TIGR02145 family)